MKVHDVMSTDVVTVEPDTPLKDAALELARRRISGVPVVNADGAVLGVLSEADVIAKERTEPAGSGFLRWLLDPADPWLRKRVEATTAGEAMSTPAITIGPDRPIGDAATLMLDEGVNRLPVVDEEGRLVGLVSRADVLRSFVREDEEIRAEIEQDIVKRVLWLDPGELRVRVERGAVTVEGSVETEQDARLLETLAGRVPGVVAVSSTVRAREHAPA